MISSNFFLRKVDCNSLDKYVSKYANIILSSTTFRSAKFRRKIMEPDYPGNMYISYKGLEILCSGLRGINANKLFITIHSINDKKSECMRAEIVLPGENGTVLSW